MYGQSMGRVTAGVRETLSKGDGTPAYGHSRPSHQDTCTGHISTSRRLGLPYVVHVFVTCCHASQSC